MGPPLDPRAGAPTIEELPIDEMWVDFRPGSRDDAPILGPTPIEGLTVATGHHRNGILLAPATGELVADLLLGRPTRVPAADYAAVTIGS